jgi:4-hydroxy-tetrahydrodipicolinate synthase
MREMWDAAQAGDLARAAEIDRGLRDVYEVLGLVTNPIPLKAALAMTGLIPHGGLRLPLYELDSGRRATVRETLEAAGVAVGG